MSRIMFSLIFLFAIAPTALASTPFLELYNYQGEKLSVYVANPEADSSQPSAIGKVRIVKNGNDLSATDIDKTSVAAALTALYENEVSYSGFTFYDQDWQAYRPECTNAGWGNNLACGVATIGFDQAERAAIYKTLIMDSVRMMMTPYPRQIRVVEEADGTRLIVLKPMLSHYTTIASVLSASNINLEYKNQFRICTLLQVIRDAGLTYNLKQSLTGVPSSTIDDIMDALPTRLFPNNASKVAMENEVVAIMNKHYRLTMLEKAYTEYKSHTNPLYDPAIQDAITASRSAMTTNSSELLDHVVHAFLGSFGTIAEGITYLAGVTSGPHQSYLTGMLIQSGVTQNMAAAQVNAAYSALNGAISTWNLYTGYDEEFHTAFLLANLISLVNNSRYSSPDQSNYTYSTGSSPLNKDMVLTDMPNVMKELGAQYETQYYSTILGIVDPDWKGAFRTLALDMFSFARATYQTKGAALNLWPYFFIGSANSFGAAIGSQLSTLANSSEITWASSAYTRTMEAMQVARQSHDGWAENIWKEAESVNLQPILALLLKVEETSTPLDPADGMFAVYGTPRIYTNNDLWSTGYSINDQGWELLYVAPLGSDVDVDIDVSQYNSVAIRSEALQQYPWSRTHRYDFIGMPSAIGGIQASSNLEGGWASFLQAVQSVNEGLTAYGQSLLLRTYGGPTLRIVAISEPD